MQLSSRRDPDFSLEPLALVIFATAILSCSVLSCPVPSWVGLVRLVFLMSCGACLWGGDRRLRKLRCQDVMAPIRAMLRFVVEAVVGAVVGAVV